MNDGDKYKKFLDASEALDSAEVPTKNRHGIDEQGKVRQFTDANGDPINEPEDFEEVSVNDPRVRKAFANEYIGSSYDVRIIEVKKTAMTNEQILTKAVAKAQANGYLPNFIVRYDDGMGWTLRGRGTVTVTDSGVSAPVTYMLSEFDIVFDHDFAKALWGEQDIYHIGDSHYNPALPEWQARLQQMVIAPDPVKYLGENL